MEQEFRKTSERLIDYVALVLDHGESSIRKMASGTKDTFPYPVESLIQMATKQLLGVAEQFEEQVGPVDVLLEEDRIPLIADVLGVRIGGRDTGHEAE